MLNKFESVAMGSILEREAPDLLGCIPTLEVTGRTHTGVGFFTDLSSESSRKVASDQNLTFGKTAYADIDGLRHGVGFVLYVGDGLPSLLEVFSHAGEEIPRNIQKFRFRNTIE